MGISKTEAFSEGQNKIARMAKALGHPARIAIIQYLLEKESCHCGGLVEKLPLSQASVSQHLKELKNIGLIKGEIEGPRMCYCINKTEWGECKKVLEAFFSSPVRTEDCCS